MTSKLLFLKNNKDTTNDELALVKAAAWAWLYQHGSGSEGNKAMSESKATRAQSRTPRPSRYKLEAMRRSTAADNSDNEEEAKEDQDKKDNNSLLDAYEVEKISRHIDGIIESNNNKNKQVVNYGTNKNNTTSATNLVKKDKKKKKKKNGKGFWVIRHGAVCGRGEDVVEYSNPALRRSGGGGARQSAKRVPAPS